MSIAVTSHFEASRPHEIKSGFLAWRQELNKKGFSKIHPTITTIRNWRLSVSMMIHPHLQKPRKVVLVNSEEKLVSMVNVFKFFNEFSVDIKAAEYTYFPLVHLISISTFEKEYIVDCIELFSFIEKYLRPFFEDGTKVKIFESSNRLSALQINFSIFTIGFIDIGEAFKLVSSDDDTSMKNMVNALLRKDYDYNEYGVLLDRPMNSDVIDHAGQDSFLLFECWIEIKNRYPNLEDELFENSKAASCKLVGNFHAPFEVVWKTYIEKMSSCNMSFFCTERQHKLCHALFNWRDEVSKNLDVHPFRLLSNEQLHFLCRAMPSSTKYLENPKFINVYGMIKLEHYEDALGIINFHKQATQCISQIEQPTFSMSKNAQKQRRYRLNCKLNGTLNKRNIRLVGKQKRVKTFVRSAKRYKITPNDIKTYLNMN